MTPLARTLGGFTEVVARNHLWMTWNLIPLPPTSLLLCFGGVIGVGLMVLFCPTPPTFVTDLVHLHTTWSMNSDAAVITPVSCRSTPPSSSRGSGAFAFVLSEVGVTSAVGLGRWRLAAEAACTVRARSAWCSAV